MRNTSRWPAAEPGQRPTATLANTVRPTESGKVRETFSLVRSTTWGNLL